MLIPTKARTEWVMEHPSKDLSYWIMVMLPL